MKKSVFVILLSVFTSVLLLGCEKNQNNNRNGDSRFERQISSCFSYQLDGHFETIMGSIAYMAQLPASAVWDTLICAEEIATGLWDHVS